MGINDILARLKKTKSTGKDRWVACCPAHPDKNPSMTIRSLPDGRILLHCFAGCDPGTIIHCLGLEFSDLFPEPLSRERLRPIRAPFSALEALECLRTESAIVAFAVSDVVDGKPLSQDDALRVARAAGLIASAWEGVNGG